MLLDMEQHSTLLSLNPFNGTSSTGSSSAAVTVSAVTSALQASSPMPPPLYGSPPLGGVSSYNISSCSQQNMVLQHHQQQHQQQQQHHHHQDHPQQQQQHQHHHHHPHNSSLMSYGAMSNMDTYLFSSGATGSLAGMDLMAGYQLPGNSVVGGGDLPDTKDGIEELCPVCGDKVSGYHYGLLTCESCKGFFKRTVQNKKVYTCVAERSCHIDKTQRKRCPYCRFQKCLDVGMKLEAVRADRMRGGRNKFGPMYKRDRARKLQMMRQRQLAAQTIAQRGHLPDGTSVYAAAGPGQPGASPFGNIHIKQEIQIPQVSSLTSSPDSSPSPIAVALGQVSSAQLMQPASSQQPALQIVGISGAGSPMLIPGAGGGGGGHESKLWASANSTTATSPHSLSPKSFQFDGGSSGGTTTTSTTVLAPGSVGVPPSGIKVSPLIRDFVQAIDDREWQNSLYSLLQNQTYNQCEVDLFELMCKVLDQNLFSQVDWARNSVFFKDLKQVDDQMKLLQHSWSDMLVLDHIHQRMHNNLPDETTLHNGQKFDLLSLGLLGVPSLADHFNDITSKLQELKFDVSDYICLKFLLLLNPVRGITNRKHVQDGYEQVQQALLEYTVTCYPQVQDKFSKMMQLLSDIHTLAARGEEHLYHKHCNGGAPTQTLLMEMLHAKRK
ncbi:nuclear hormone receptor FTZ-F1-like isoform X4 [Agrilus planipennis]|uniref:Nuclear hormone receptor FTZ-F1 n=1 Tax=Agrilus planipennis TaxID=224129 RepID=A0A1W4WXR3_AGRPL|nr:nuclear hormone receptor FTZ-F1-like isoform X4 [Agrilus planipennis]